MMAVFIRICIILSAAVLVSTAKSGYCKRKCPCDNMSSGVYLLPSESKTQYYQCDFGGAKLRDCGPGTHFNPELQICGWPEYTRAVKCGANHGEFVKCKRKEDESSEDEDS